MIYSVYDAELQDIRLLSFAASSIDAKILLV